MSIDELLRTAILARLQVHATYGGHRRALCPHVLGMKDGRRHCLFFQFGGTSARAGTIVPGGAHDWRCLEVDGLCDVVVRTGAWFTAERHLRPQRCIDEVDVQVTNMVWSAAA